MITVTFIKYNEQIFSLFSSDSSTTLRDDQPITNNMLLEPKNRLARYRESQKSTMRSKVVSTIEDRRDSSRIRDDVSKDHEDLSIPVDIIQIKYLDNYKDKDILDILDLIYELKVYTPNNLVFDRPALIKMRICIDIKINDIEDYVSKMNIKYNGYFLLEKGELTFKSSKNEKDKTQEPAFMNLLMPNFQKEEIEDTSPNANKCTVTIDLNSINVEELIDALKRYFIRINTNFNVNKILLTNTLDNMVLKRYEIYIYEFNIKFPFSLDVAPQSNDICVLF